MAVVAATAASVGAQWPTGCVELNDIVELHLSNTDNVGIYQQVFGNQAEAACRADHRTDVQTTFAWAFGTSPAATAETPTTPTAQPDEGWPTTCVYLNDVVEAWLGNDHNVGIYARTFGDQAEARCQHDHAGDVRQTFTWAGPMRSGDRCTRRTNRTHPGIRRSRANRWRPRRIESPARTAAFRYAMVGLLHLSMAYRRHFRS